MDKYHITTTVALFLDGIIIISLVIAGVGKSFISTGIWQLLALQAPNAIGIMALVLCIVGQVKQKTTLGIILIILNSFFSLWLIIRLLIAAMAILLM